MNGRIELLAPARNRECAFTAIDCGADSVYIGAPRFGAREDASNTIEDIAEIVSYAHRYWAKVYVTVNTILKDSELPDAVRLIHRLYDAGVDAIIIQDTGLLESDLPPIPIIASTQMHNNTPPKIAFLEKTGFNRAILARELSIDEIRSIHLAAPDIELEYFIHGSLCVSYSGQCYLSYSLGGRSGNRGCCAQPCRKIYDLIDSSGKTIISQKHLLCLKDLNLTDHLCELISAGITSFKIEGRLKDEFYVANVVSWYRRQLNEILPGPGLKKSSSGTSHTEFTPDIAKVFNRGFTDYFIHGRNSNVASIDTPKMSGETIGTVTLSSQNFVEVDTNVELHPGDGLAFFDSDGFLTGTLLNKIDGKRLFLNDTSEISPGTILYRNFDQSFTSAVRKSRNKRTIDVEIRFSQDSSGILLTAIDEDGNTAQSHPDAIPVPAKQPDKAAESIRKQLSKTGGTEFQCTSVSIDITSPPFFPVSELNAMRRKLLEELSAQRLQNRPRMEYHPVNTVTYPEKHLTYLGNVLNSAAERFYKRRGVEQIQPAAESGLDMSGLTLMTMRYCLKHELGICHKQHPSEAFDEPLFLIDTEGHRFRLEFDCSKCEMRVVYDL